MDGPLEITFHKLEKPAWADESIRDRVAKLEKLYARLSACRVRVDQRSDPAKAPPVVHVEMSVPGYDRIVVAYEPGRLQRKFQNPDLQQAINDAFAAAERQLLDFKSRREDAPANDRHDVHRQFLGQIAELDKSGDHGFLMTKEGGLLYFHRNSLLNGEFDKLKRGDPVHYVQSVGDTGPTASKVRPVSEK